jgi:hypothetical protein
MTVERPGDKLVVWAEKVEGRRIGVAYPTMEEAHMAATSLESSGYRVIQIVRKSNHGQSTGHVKILDAQ